MGISLTSLSGHTLHFHFQQRLRPEVLAAWLARHVRHDSGAGLRGEALPRGPARWYTHAVALDRQHVDAELTQYSATFVFSEAPHVEVLGWLATALAELGPARCYLGHREVLPGAEVRCVGCGVSLVAPLHPSYCACDLPVLRVALQTAEEAEAEELAATCPVYAPVTLGQACGAAASRVFALRGYVLAVEESERNRRDS